MRRGLCSGLVAACALASPLAAQSADGQRYAVAGGPLFHVATKAAASAGVYLLLHEAARVPRVPAALLSTAGVLALAKALELARGHRLGPVDTLHDLTWHSLPVLGITLRGRLRISVLGAGSLGILLTCGRASPRWC